MVNGIDRDLDNPAHDYVIAQLMRPEVAIELPKLIWPQAESLGQQVKKLCPDVGVNKPVELPGEGDNLHPLVKLLGESRRSPHWIDIKLMGVEAGYRCMRGKRPVYTDLLFSYRVDWVDVHSFRTGDRNTRIEWVYNARFSSVVIRLPCEVKIATVTASEVLRQMKEIQADILYSAFASRKMLLAYTTGMSPEGKSILHHEGIVPFDFYEFMEVVKHRQKVGAPS